jgi:hypothetical protein
MTTYFNDTDELTQRLDEDWSGANGELAEDAVFDRLMESIRKATDIVDDVIPIESVARLLLAMHRHMQGDRFHLQAMCNGWELPKLDDRWDLRRALMLMAHRVTTRAMLLKEAEADQTS